MQGGGGLIKKIEIGIQKIQNQPQQILAGPRENFLLIYISQHLSTSTDLI